MPKKLDKKAIITSDLHYGITSPVRIMLLKNEFLSIQPDVVIIAGDIGEPWMEFDKCLSLFSEAKCPVGVILGNHELYATAGCHSEELWSITLPGIVERLGFVWMETDSIVIDQTAFIGTMAWYDYSSKAPRFGHLSDEDFYHAKSQLVADGVYIDWLRKDTVFAKELKEGFLNGLSKLQGNPEIERIIVVTHVPLFSEQMVSHRSDSRQADAYFGNLTLGQEILKFDKVTNVISGHTHRPVDAKVNNVHVQIIPGDYRDTGYLVLDF